ncbi:MAG TPA: MATE family efflux transporter, partial [Myxococcota bacterium]
TFWRLCVPSVLGLGLLGINSFVDALAVGCVLGEEALAGAGVGFALSNIPFAVGNLVGGGAAAVLSNAIGARDVRVFKVLFGSVVAMSLVLGGVVAVAGTVLAPQLAAALGASGVAHAAAVDFFRVQSLGTPLISFGLAMNMMTRGEGKVRAAMIKAAIGASLNMLLAFPMCRAFGTSGAAAAGLAASCVYAALGLVWYGALNGRGFATVALQLRGSRVDVDVVRGIFKAGLPQFVMGAMQLVQMVLVYRALASFGSAHDAAVYGALARISMLASFPIFGFMRAFQPVVGIAWGARRADLIAESLRVFVVGGLILVTALLLPMITVTTSFFALVLPGTAIDDADLLHARVYLLPFFGYPIAFMGMTLMQNTDAGGLASALSLGRQLVLFVPAVLLLPPLLGVFGIYVAFASVDVVIVAVVVVFLLRDRARWQARAASADAGAT